MTTFRPLETRFWEKVDTTSGLLGCWPWQGFIGSRGYGAFWDGKTNRGAHRVSLELHLGRPLAPGMEACHSCDNPPCVNPGHLFEGTTLDNARDKVVKGRQARGDLNGSRLHPERLPRGARHGSRTHPERLPRGELWREQHAASIARGERVGGARLTAQRVREIREAAASGATFTSLASAHGVTRQAVAQLVARRTWVHVP